MKSAFTFVGYSIVAFAALLLCAFAYHLARTKIDERLYPPPGQLVDVGGYRLHLHCMGEGGPTVVLDAGMGSFSLIWTLVQPEIAKFARVCSYDRAGLGWSEPSPHPRTTIQMADELHALLHQAHVPGPYILVGHSAAGLTARAFAVKYPDEVFGIVLVDASHEMQDLLFPDAPAESTGKAILGQIIDFALTRSGPLGSRRWRIHWLRKPLLPLPEAIQDEYLALSSTTKDFTASHREKDDWALSLQEFTHLPRSLGNKPVVVITASKAFRAGVTDEKVRWLSEVDTIWDAMQRDLATISTNGKQLFADHSGHMIPLQQPEIIVEAVKEEVNTYQQEHQL